MSLLAALWLLSAAPAAAAPVRLLVLGDSLAAGYGLAAADGFEAQLAAALKARGHDVIIVDGAVSGDTTAGALARLDWALGGDGDAKGADAAIVELGGNDGLRGIDPRNTESNLAAILDQLAARHIPTLLTGMLAPPNLGPDYGDAFKSVYARLAAARPGVVFDPFFLDGVAADPALNQADHIHPNPEGVKKEVARILPRVEQLLAKVQAGGERRLMRLFVALDLPPMVRQRLGFLASGLPGARWVSPGNYHITLRFIGECPPYRCEEVGDALAALRAPGFEMSLAGIGVFDRNGRPASPWAGVDRTRPLEHLQSKIETALQRIGLEPERKRFVPHLTLARLGDVPQAKLAEWVQHHNLLRTEPLPVGHFTLFSSRLGKEQAVYEPEVEYELK